MTEPVKLSRKKMHKKDTRKNREGFIEGLERKAGSALPDGSKTARLGRVRDNPDYQPKPVLTEKPESIEERGAVAYAILRAYHADLTVYEVAKRAGMLSSIDDVRRTLAYHKKKCKSMRDRIDDLARQLEGKAGIKVIL